MSGLIGHPAGRIQPLKLPCLPGRRPGRPLGFIMARMPTLLGIAPIVRWMADSLPAVQAASSNL